MIHKKSSIRSAFVLMAALAIVALPLAAGQADAITDTDTETTTTTSEDTPVSTTNTTTNSDEQTDDSAEIQRRVNAAKKKAQTEVENARKTVQTKTQEKRKQLCENRKNAIDNKLNAFTNAADKHLARLNNAYSKLKDYQTKNNVTVSNYDALISAADTKQQAATEAVAALKNVSSGVDCTSADVAVQLKTVKEAAASTRDALKAYRTSLHNILVALAQATKTTTEDSTSEGSNQ